MLNRTSSAENSSTGLTDDTAPVKPVGFRYTDGSASVLCAICFGDQVKKHCHTGWTNGSLGGFGACTVLLPKDDVKQREVGPSAPVKSTVHTRVSMHSLNHYSESVSRGQEPSLQHWLNWWGVGVMHRFNRWQLSQKQSVSEESTANFILWVIG